MSVPTRPDRPHTYSVYFGERDGAPNSVRAFLRPVRQLVAEHQPQLLEDVELAIACWGPRDEPVVEVGSPVMGQFSLSHGVDSTLDAAVCETLELTFGTLRLVIDTTAGFCIDDCRIELACEERELFEAALRAVGPATPAGE